MFVNNRFATTIQAQVRASFTPSPQLIAYQMDDEKGDRVAEDSKSKDSSEQPIDAEAGLSAPLQTKAMIIDQEMNRYGMGRYQW